jgi:hypothetical protein
MAYDGHILLKVIEKREVLYMGYGSLRIDV